MMKLVVFFKSFLTKNILFTLIGVTVALFAFQNCGQTRFSEMAEVTSSSKAGESKTPFCSPGSRPSDYEQVSCLPPQHNVRLAIQFYNVVCQDSGEWTRFPNGVVNYSPCIITCNQSERPSDFENSFCPAPFENEKKVVETYNVRCASNGRWMRTLDSVDHSLCTRSCDPATKPPTSSPISCPAPNNSILSGVQNYQVTCLPNGNWNRQETSTNYAACPQSCDTSQRPSEREVAACPSTRIMNAYQLYTVTCNQNGTWDRLPGTLDTSACPTSSCDAATKPAASENVFCPAPNHGKKLAVQNYSVTCSGTSWTRTSGVLDVSACPKSCDGPAPANDSTKVSCQSPFQTDILAVQNYKYICNATTGQYDRTADGVVNYSACPKSCTGVVPPTSVEVACPAGTTGTAYQYYDVVCNAATGQYESTKRNLDTNSCVIGMCTGTKPLEQVPTSCPAPFDYRNDAIKNYYVQCQLINGTYTWTSNHIDTNTASCPTNDCSRSVNPGNEKIIGACSGGATGSIFQTCSVSCSGDTYIQTSCSANNYSRCDCGANATYNTVTKTCVANPVTCVAGTKNLPEVDCGAGYNGGKKYQVERTTCPNGPYGLPVKTTDSSFVTTSCVSCPAPSYGAVTPTCGPNQTAVANSKTYEITYSCATGSAVATRNYTSDGICNANAATCSPDSYLDRKSCGAGYSGGMKTRTVSITCPDGNYGAPRTDYTPFDTSQCLACPAPVATPFTPTCGTNQVAVPNSGISETRYSCSTGSPMALAPVVTNPGICNPKPVTCSVGQTTSPPVACGDNKTGTKTTTTYVTCPQGEYGPPSSNPVENLGACKDCPAPHNDYVTPTCDPGFTPVPGSQTLRTTYSCATGTAVPTTTPLNSGTCNPVAVTPSCDGKIMPHSWSASQNACVGRYEYDFCAGFTPAQYCSVTRRVPCAEPTEWSPWNTQTEYIGGVKYLTTERSRCEFYTIWLPGHFN